MEGVCGRFRQCCVDERGNGGRCCVCRFHIAFSRIIITSFTCFISIPFTHFTITSFTCFINIPFTHFTTTFTHFTTTFTQFTNTTHFTTTTHLTTTHRRQDHTTITIHSTPLPAGQEPVAAPNLHVHLRRAGLRIRRSHHLHRHASHHGRLVRHYFLLRHVDLHQPQSLSREQRGQLREGHHYA